MKQRLRKGGGEAVAVPEVEENDDGFVVESDSQPALDEEETGRYPVPLDIGNPRILEEYVRASVAVNFDLKRPPTPAEVKALKDKETKAVAYTITTTFDEVYSCTGKLQYVYA